MPRDVEAECATLGSILIDPTVIDEVRDALSSPEDFYGIANAAVYNAMITLHDDGTGIDIVKLTGRLSDQGMLGNVGGVEYLADVLLESTPSAVSAGHYAGRVAEKALRRKAIAEQEVSLSALYDESTPLTRTLDSAMNRLIEMKPDTGVDEAHIAHYLDEAMEDDRPVVHSGMKSLDNIIEGFEMGTLTIVGARPSVGKTAWGISAALNMTTSGTPLGFISAEMNGRRVGRRMVCADAQISTKEFDRDKHSEHVKAIIEQQKSLPMWVDQTPGIHIDKVCSRIRRWKREHGIQVAFADYIQLFSGDGDSEYERVTAAARKLQAVAKETDVALFVLAQVNRQSMGRQDKRPTMSDLKGSGEIEQAADVILLLHRDSYCASGADILDGKVNDHEAEIIVAKNRDGATDTAHVGWIGRCGVFSSGVGAGHASPAQDVLRGQDAIL